MEQPGASVTARISAFGRAYHAEHDSPLIFDDSLASRFLTAEERALFSRNLAESLKFFDPERAAESRDEASALAAWMRAQSAPITLSRARYVEDALVREMDAGVRQYVILGAGLDTFAWRRSDLMPRLTVLELDHPATQALKRERAPWLGEFPQGLRFVPVDFARQDLAAVLSQDVFDRGALTLFNWLGVTYYLDRPAFESTLRAIALTARPGSSVIFDYLDDEAFTPSAGRRVRLMQEAARMSGEPMKTGLNPAALAAELSGLGLSLVENLGPVEIEARFFSGRTDGYHAFEHIHFAFARVL